MTKRRTKGAKRREAPAGTAEARRKPAKAAHAASPSAPERTIGATVLLQMLRREGADVLFGYPGGAALPLFDEIYRMKYPFILSRHEQGATHMADGYTRASGKSGVVVVTSGPGATNCVTGLATAAMDSIPVVMISGQVPTRMIGNDAFQEADVVGITRPVTKHNYLVKDVGDIARSVAEAFHIARTGRPGPVVLDLPKDIQEMPCEPPPKEVPLDLPGYKPTREANPRQIERAAEAIALAQRPVLYVGGGALLSEASGPLRKLAERADIPVTMTLMGLGAFPGTHRLSLGMLGMHGTAYANAAVTHSDLLIAVGARFDDRVTGKISEFAKGARKIHIDIDPTSISKNVRVDIPIVGDARRTLEALVALVPRTKHAEWIEQIDGWRKRYPLSYPEDGLPPQFVIEKIHEATKGEAIIATDVGQHQMWAAQYYHYDEPRTFLSSAGLGTMGYGFPAAIGAKVARPEKPVVCISGDGSIQMQIQQLGTAVTHGIGVKVAILNNQYLGMVRQWQQLFYERRYSATELANPDFVAIAKAYGAEGYRVEEKKDVLPALERALASDAPVFIDFRVNPEENVYPMVPAGGRINEIVFPQGIELL